MRQVLIGNKSGKDAGVAMQGIAMAGVLDITNRTRMSLTDSIKGRCFKKRTSPAKAGKAFMFFWA